MTPEQACASGNQAIADLCKSLLDKYGPTPDYEIAVTAAATTILFHVYRLGLHHGEGKGKEILQGLLDDVAHNIHARDETILKFKVEER